MAGPCVRQLSGWDTISGRPVTLSYVHHFLLPDKRFGKTRAIFFERSMKVPFCAVFSNSQVRELAGVPFSNVLKISLISCAIRGLGIQVGGMPSAS